MKLLAFLLSYYCAFCFIPFTSPSAYSQSLNADNLFDFADALFQEGDYLNAVHEYKRYLYLYPRTNKSDWVQLRIAAAYQNVGMLQVAIAAYQSLIDTYPNSPFIEKARSNIAQCQLLQGDEATATASLQQFLSDYPESELAPRAQFTIAMIYMEGEDWASASKAWQQVVIKYPQTPFGAMSDRLSRMVQYEASLPRRSPTVAGMLSAAIPGLGQMYSGRFSDGMHSLAVVGALSGGIAYYIDQERDEVAIPLAIIGLFYHLSNIYRGVESARAFNLQQENRLLNEMRKEISESNLFGASDRSPSEIPLGCWRSRF